jgi:hypothetical protein
MSSKTRVTGAGSEATPDIERSDPSGGSTAEASTESSIEREQIFEILSNERRRLVIRYIKRHDGDRIDFRDLVDQLAAWENDTTREEVDSNDRKCVYTALRQTHLPKLDRFGVIEYDNQRGSIEARGAVEDVVQYMDHVPERGPLWSRLYLLLAVLCGAVTLLVWTGIAPLGRIPEIGVAIGIVVAFGGFAVAQIYQSRRRGPPFDGPE